LTKRSGDGSTEGRLRRGERSESTTRRKWQPRGESRSDVQLERLANYSCSTWPWEIGRRDRTCTCMGFRPRVSETRVYTLHHSPKKLVRPERLARSTSSGPRATSRGTLTRLAARRFLRPLGLLLFASPPSGTRAAHPLAALGASPSPRFALRPRTEGAARQRRAERRTSRCGLRARASKPEASQSHPHWLFAHRLLGPTCLLFHHVRMKRMEHPQGRAPCSLSYQDSPSLSTAWMHGRSGRTRTFVAREGIAFTARCICCSATLRKIGGSSGIRTRDRLLMRELRSLLRHRAKLGGRLGEAKRSGAPAGAGQGPERAARVKCSEFGEINGLIRFAHPFGVDLRSLHLRFAPSKSAVLLIRRHRNKSGQGDRTCTCMISLPRGVADYLAPHPDVEIEPARRHVRSGPVLFSVISESAGGGRSRRVR
jgi:hypothetical protein